MHKNYSSISMAVYIFKKKKTTEYMDILQRQFSGGLIPTVIKENQSSSNGGL